MSWPACIFMDPSIDTGAQTTLPEMHWGPLSSSHAGLLELWHISQDREHVSAVVQMRPQQCSPPQVIICMNTLLQPDSLACSKQSFLWHWKVVFELSSQHRKKNKYLKNSSGTDVHFPLAPRVQTTTQPECKYTLPPTLPPLIVYSPILITLTLFSPPWIFFFWLLSLTHTLLSFLFLTLFYLILLFSFPSCSSLSLSLGNEEVSSLFKAQKPTAISLVGWWCKPWHKQLIWENIYLQLLNWIYYNIQRISVSSILPVGYCLSKLLYRF